MAVLFKKKVKPVTPEEAGEPPGPELGTTPAPSEKSPPTLGQQPTASCKPFHRTGGEGRTIGHLSKEHGARSPVEGGLRNMHLSPTIGGGTRFSTTTRASPATDADVDPGSPEMPSRSSPLEVATEDEGSSPMGADNVEQAQARPYLATNYPPPPVRVRGVAAAPVTKTAPSSVPQRVHKVGDVFSRTGDPVEELNRKHFVVIVGGKACIATITIDPNSGYLDIQLGTQGDIALIHKNWVVDDTTAAKLWLSSPLRRQYSRIDFLPDREVPGVYNLWQGFGVTPRKGNCSLFWQHLFFVICTKKRRIYRYLRKYLAHLVQHPAELPGVAIVIRGKQGTGKTIVVEILGDLVGKHYLALDSMDQLTGRFSEHLKDALLVSVNEAIWRGDNAGAGVLKAMVTNNKIAVEGKGKPIYNVWNYKRIIVTTNYDNAVPMDLDDRRFLVLEASEEHKEDKNYFGALLDQMNHEGKEALFYDLMREDLTGFDVRTKPDSPYGFDIKMRNAEPIVKWWFEFLHEETDETWNLSPNKDALHGSFLSFCETYQFRKLDKPDFTKQLQKLMPRGILGTTKLSDGSGRGTRMPCYKMPSIQECRRAFQLYTKSGEEIWGE